PVWGATTTIPSPTYMPTWYGAPDLAPMKTRSDGARSDGDSELAMCQRSAAVGRPGSGLPAAAYAKSTRPEQSNPPSARLSPPHTYGQPTCASAATTAASGPR